MSREAAYVPLWCRSNYSFLEGASHPEELVATADHLGLPALAITDRHGVYALPRAHQACRPLEGRVRLLCGAQVSLKGSPEETPESLLLLAQNETGWRTLCRLLTLGATRAEKGECRLHAADLNQHHRGLIAIWPALETSCWTTPEPDCWRIRGGPLREVFGDRLYLGLMRHRRPAERQREARLRARAEALDVPLVALRETLYHRPSRQRLHDVLTCLRHRCALASAGSKLKPNSDYGMLSAAQMRELYQDCPQAVERTLEVRDRCHFSLQQLRYRYPNEALPEGKSSAQWLRELAYDGARRRYGPAEWPEVEAQLEKELGLIVGLDYVGYFLTMYEIVEFCRSQAILCQGRGSAANSLVCFCLGITAVDPHKLGLLFERFISAERAEPPDIDLDIMHQRREEVIAWVYQRYGRERAAMVCNVVRYRPRSAIREVGKVLQIETPVIERVARLLTGFCTRVDQGLVEAAGLPQEAPEIRLWLDLVHELIGFPRHLSVHPGGFLLGSEPIDHLVPIEKARMEGRTVIQWDKYDVESLGLFKVDLLGLGALSQLDLAFRLLRQHRGLELSMETLPVADERTFDKLCQGDSVGVFQVESRAQMAMLPLLRPRCFYDLVIQVAIIRPGPITGGMVHPYLRRRSGEEEVDYPHPSLKPVLEKTLGIPLFQEQVMRLAVVAADYTPGEADQLRRDMAAWSSHGKLERHRERLLRRMVAKGIAPEFAERVFAQIQGFGEYGFPESHAASFALITYATSYLRAHYPAEFTCSLLNALPMGFYAASTLVEDARRQGVEVRPFCAERSSWECTLEPRRESFPEQLALWASERPAAAQPKAHPEPPPLENRPFAVRLGLKFLKGLSQEAAKRVVDGRPYRSARELSERAALDRKSLEILATSGALEVYGRSRRDELWAVEHHLQARTMPLLKDWDESHQALAPLRAEEEVLWDYQASGLSSRGHPLRALRRTLRRAGYLEAREVGLAPHGRWVRTAALVICRQRPATAKGTVFFTLEDETGLLNVIVWSKVYEANLVVARSPGLLAVEGRVQRAHGVVHLVAHRLARPELGWQLELPSRDFH